MDITRYDKKIQDLYLRQQTALQNMDAEVLPVLRQLLKHAKKLQDDELLGYVYRSISFAEYFITGRYESFIKHAMAAARHLLRCNDNSEIMHVYYLVGLDALNKGFHDIAYHLFTTARNMAEETGQTTAAAILEETIGHILLQVGDFRQARKFLKKSLRIVRKDPSHPHYFNNVTSCYMNDGEACLNLGLLDEARKNYEKTRQFIESHDHTFHMDVELNLALLGTKIALFAEDRQLTRKRFDDMLKLLTQLPQITIYVSDLHMITKMLLQADDKALAGKLVKTISTRKPANDATEAQRVYVETLIAYYTATNNRSKLMDCYMEQDRIYARLLTEQKESRRYTRELITLANELQQEQAVVTDRRKELLHQARTDSLTGLPNRYAANLHMDQIFEKAYREGLTFAAGIIDMDDLKSHNERFGHAAGDELIVDLAKAMEQAMEDPRIFIARYGGDEFLVLCTDMESGEIRSTLNSIRKNTEAAFSAGICLRIPQGKVKSWDFLVSADKELYRIKNKKHRGDKTGDIGIRKSL